MKHSEDHTDFMIGELKDDKNIKFIESEEARLTGNDAFKESLYEELMSTLECRKDFFGEQLDRLNQTLVKLDDDSPNSHNLRHYAKLWIAYTERILVAVDAVMENRLK